MSTSYLGAKRAATKSGFDVVYHDFDTNEYGACPRGQPHGHYEAGQFHKHICLYFPSSMSAIEMEEAEDQKFVDDPYWQEAANPA
jgi:hypothetical protein